MPRFTKRSRMGLPPEDVFAWHARPGALERLLPPWESANVMERSGGISDGSRTVLRMRRGPLSLRWVAVHRDYQHGRSFTDEQVEGPFAYWRHTHRFLPEGHRHCLLEDEIEYRLPLSPWSQALAGPWVRRELDRTFRFRHQRTAADLSRHAASRGARPLRVAISGASGLVGTALSAFLTAGGHRVTRLVRRPAEPDAREVYWRPSEGAIDAAGLEGLDAVIHLAGRSIAALRWTRAIKRSIWESRVTSTRLLSETLASLNDPPSVLVSASAAGYYGDRGAEILDERSSAGDGFLSDLCQAWEAACEPARQAGIRVVNPRSGVVITASGGLLARVLWPYRLGLGGVLGSGQQFMSWIALDDLLGLILHAITNDNLAGPVNAVSPNPVSQREFTRTLGRVLRRPTPFPLPAPLLKAGFGQMGQELFLYSARLTPAVSTATGFTYLFRDLEDALRFELGRQ